MRREEEEGRGGGRRGGGKGTEAVSELSMLCPALPRLRLCNGGASFRIKRQTCGMMQSSLTKSKSCALHPCSSRNSRCASARNWPIVHPFST